MMGDCSLEELWIVVLMATAKSSVYVCSMPFNMDGREAYRRTTLLRSVVTTAGDCHRDGRGIWAMTTTSSDFVNISGTRLLECKCCCPYATHEFIIVDFCWLKATHTGSKELVALQIAQIKAGRLLLWLALVVFVHIISLELSVAY